MTRMRYVCIGLALLVVSCAKTTPPNLTPTERAEYQRLQQEGTVLDSLLALERFAIDSSDRGGIPQPLARQIVRFSMVASSTLRQQPASAKVVITAAWTDTDLAPDQPGTQSLRLLMAMQPSLVQWISTIDELVRGLK